MLIEHGELLTRIHAPVAQTFVDQITREAFVSVNINDIYKMALQSNDNTLWVLINNAPMTQKEFKQPQQIVQMDSFSGVNGSTPDPTYQTLSPLYHPERVSFLVNNNELELTLISASNDAPTVVFYNNIIFTNDFNLEIDLDFTLLPKVFAIELCFDIGGGDINILRFQVDEDSKYTTGIYTPTGGQVLSGGSSGQIQNTGSAPFTVEFLRTGINATAQVEGVPQLSVTSPFVGNGLTQMSFTLDCPSPIGFKAIIKEIRLTKGTMRG